MKKTTILNVLSLTLILALTMTTSVSVGAQDSTDVPEIFELNFTRDFDKEAIMDWVEDHSWEEALDMLAKSHSVQETEGLFGSTQVTVYTPVVYWVGSHYAGDKRLWEEEKIKDRYERTVTDPEESLEIVYRRKTYSEGETGLKKDNLRFVLEDRTGQQWEAQNLEQSSLEETDFFGMKGYVGQISAEYVFEEGPPSFDKLTIHVIRTDKLERNEFTLKRPRNLRAEDIQVETEKIGEFGDVKVQITNKRAYAWKNVRAVVFTEKGDSDWVDLGSIPQSSKSSFSVKKNTDLTTQTINKIRVHASDADGLVEGSIDYSVEAELGPSPRPAAKIDAQELEKTGDAKITITNDSTFDWEITVVKLVTSSNNAESVDIGGIPEGSARSFSIKERTGLSDQKVEQVEIHPEYEGITLKPVSSEVDVDLFIPQLNAELSAEKIDSDMDLQISLSNRGSHEWNDVTVEIIPRKGSSESADLGRVGPYQKRKLIIREDTNFKSGQIKRIVISAHSEGIERTYSKKLDVFLPELKLKPGIEIEKAQDTGDAIIRVTNNNDFEWRSSVIQLLPSQSGTKKFELDPLPKGETCSFSVKKKTDLSEDQISRLQIKTQYKNATLTQAYENLGIQLSIPALRGDLTVKGAKDNTDAVVRVENPTREKWDSVEVKALTEERSKPYLLYSGEISGNQSMELSVRENTDAPDSFVISKASVEAWNEEGISLGEKTKKASLQIMAPPKMDYSVERQPFGDFAIEPSPGGTVWKFIDGNTYRNPTITLNYGGGFVRFAGDRFAGVVFGAQNEENFYAFLISEGWYALIERSEGTFSFLTDWKSSPINPLKPMAVIVKNDFVALLSNPSYSRFGRYELDETLIAVRTDLDARDGQIGAIIGGLKEGEDEEDIFIRELKIKPTKNETVEKIKDYLEKEEEKSQHEAEL